MMEEGSLSPGGMTQVYGDYLKLEELTQIIKPAIFAHDLEEAQHFCRKLQHRGYPAPTVGELIPVSQYMKNPLCWPVMVSSQVSPGYVLLVTQGGRQTVLAVS